MTYSDEICTDLDPYEPIKKEKSNKTKFQLLRMVMVYFGIEVLFSIEVALTVPILLKLKISEKLYSYVYFLSPLFGFFLQPILGSLSDRCNSRFGRRKPFILALSLFSYAGITLILNGHLFGKWLGDQNMKIPIFGIVFTTIGVTILDLAADSCDCPLRAYLLDVCNSKDRDTSFNLHAFLGGVGAAFGYILASIDWNKTYLGKFADETQILFFISSVIFLFCLFLTMTSAKEEKYTNSKEEIENRESITQEIRDVLKSFKNIPKPLGMLLISTLIGWLAFFSTTLFFTDFVAQSIYGGIPNASILSKEYEAYNYGIKMGSLGLLSYSISSALSAVLMENYLLEKFSEKSIWLATYFIYLISCVGIYYSKNILLINLFCCSFGFLLTSLSTLPYRMLSEFYKDPLFLHKQKMDSPRGIGTDCSFISSSYFLSLVIISSFMSLLIFYLGNKIILVTGIFFSILGLLFNFFFVIFPNNQSFNYQSLKTSGDIF